MNNPIIYIILNGELEMSPGKAASQAAHAVMMLDNKSLEDFISNYKRTVIVLEAKNSEQIRNLYVYLGDTELNNDYYIDEGKNEVDAYSITALAVGPIAYDDKENREIFESFPLFTGTNESVITRRYLESQLEKYKESLYYGDRVRKIKKVLKFL